MRVLLGSEVTVVTVSNGPSVPDADLEDPLPVSTAPQESDAKMLQPIGN